MNMRWKEGVQMIVNLLPKIGSYRPGEKAAASIAENLIIDAVSTVTPTQTKVLIVSNEMGGAEVNFHTETVIVTVKDNPDPFHFHFHITR